MSSVSGQKFIKKNRAPRVHIEYEVATDGAPQKVELPFVMGVMSDLSGKSVKEKASLNDRDFEEFDMDNFEAKMANIAPRAAFADRCRDSRSAARPCPAVRFSQALSRRSPVVLRDIAERGTASCARRAMPPRVRARVARSFCSACDVAAIRGFA